MCRKKVGKIMSTKETNKPSFMMRFISGTQKVCKKIPQPLKMFTWLTVFVILLAAILHWAGVSVINPANGQPLAPNSIFTKGGIQWFFSTLVSNFSNYPAFAPVMVMVFAIGICEESGVVHSAIGRAMGGAPQKLVPLLVCFIGVMGNLAENTSLFILTPIAGFAYLAIGKNPMVGMIACYLANTSGMCANLLVSNNDVMLTGITNAAIESNAMDVAPLEVTSNWYFLIASTFLITLTVYFVTEKWISKFLDPLPEDYFASVAAKEVDPAQVALEKKGLRNAALWLLLYVVFIAAALYFGVFINKDGKNVFWDSLVGVMFGAFAVFGIAYGVSVKNIKDIDDIRRMVIKSTERMAPYIVMCFILSIFINVLGWSQLTKMLSVVGVEFLQKIHLTGLGLIIIFMVIMMFINIFSTAATAKWNIFAPVVVPIFAKLGWSPALSQIAFRISDSATNCASPFSPFLFMLVDTCRDTFKIKESSLNKWLSCLIPASLVIFVAWTLLLVVWVLLDLPLGPGAYIHMM